MKKRIDASFLDGPIPPSVLEVTDGRKLRESLLYAIRRAATAEEHANFASRLMKAGYTGYIYPFESRRLQ